MPTTEAVRRLPSAVLMASSTTSAARPCRPRSSITVVVKSALPDDEEADHRDQHEQQREQREERRQRDRRRQGSAADGAEALVDRQRVVEPWPPTSPPHRGRTRGDGTRVTRFGAVLPADLDPERIPAHVACVMDGNGRWATRRGLKRTDGHAAGEEALFDAVEGALELGHPAGSPSTPSPRRTGGGRSTRSATSWRSTSGCCSPGATSSTARACGCGSSAGRAGGCPSGCRSTSTTPRP